MEQKHTKRLGSASNATISTLLLGAILHLSLSLLAAIKTGDMAYINPVRFLGIEPFAPQLLHSLTAIIVLWSALVSIGFVLLYLRKYARVNVSIGITTPRRQERPVTIRKLYRYLTSISEY